MQSSIPFTRLSTREWSNLGLAILACLYLVFAILQLVLNGPLVYVGSDFPTLTASANIAREHGLAAVYNLDLQKQYQNHVYRSVIGVDYPYGIGPNAFLPVFVLALLPLALFDPLTAYVLWTALNLVVLFFYLRRLSKELGWEDNGALAALALSLPAFFTLLYGSTNLWLAICVGESLIAFRKGQEFRAGAWLAGWLLKPQVMILLIPGLVLARKFRAVLGAGVAGLALVVVSALLAGIDGMLSLVGLWIGFAQPAGLATNSPELMMNWRGLAIHLNQVLPDPALGWGVAGVGMLATAVLALALWLSRSAPPLIDVDKIWLGTLCATFAVTWHSHVHTALPLVVVLAFLWADAGHLPRVWIIWLAVPPLFFLPSSFLLGTAWAHTYLGILYLGLNIVGVVWAYRSVRQPHSPVPAQTA